MTTTEAAELAIETRWKTLVETPLGLLTEYDNSPDIEPDATASYARLRIFGGESPQVAVGGPRGLHRVLGLTVAEVFVPAGSGAPPARRIIDTIKNAFQGTSADGVTYETASADNIGLENGRYQVNVNISYRFEEV